MVFNDHVYRVGAYVIPSTENYGFAPASFLPSSLVANNTLTTSFANFTNRLNAAPIIYYHENCIRIV